MKKNIIISICFVITTLFFVGHFGLASTGGLGGSGVDGSRGGAGTFPSDGVGGTSPSEGVGTVPDAGAGTYPVDDSPTPNNFQKLPNPLGEDSITGLLNKIIGLITKFVAPPIVVLMVLYAGFNILTSSGDPKKIEDAKKIILYACIGYGIILIGWGFVSIIKDILF